MKNGSNLTVKIFASIADIDKNEWDDIFPDIAESYGFFKTIDESLSRQFKSYYILIYENSRIECAAPCFIMDYPLETTVEGPLKKILTRLKNIAPRLFTLRILICGCQAAEGKIGIREPGRKDIALTLVNEMYKLALKEKAHLIAFKDFDEKFTGFFGPLSKIGFHKVQGYPSVELDVRFNSFEEYLDSLSKPTRKSLRKKFKQLEEKAKIDMEITSDISGLLDEAHTLYLNTLNKSEVQFERLTKDFFKNISKNMPAETKYFLWRINGKLVAFDLCLVKGDMLVDEYIGLDYEVAYEYSLYYVSFRDIVSWCIQNGIHKYESGALNYDPKKRLDFKFIPEYIYFKHRNFFLNFLFGMLSSLLKPENYDPVLKAMQEERI
ncbi:MAG: GNAT family N-acetyltransferase [Candidatus Omnitrophica bacterium]|nr:GNAT family N-acetyltransferase [Candidatus Omnitrophota bacterium]